MSDATTAAAAATPPPAPAPAAPPAPTAPPAAATAVDADERGDITTGRPIEPTDEAAPPKHDAPKDEWLAHARRKGYDRGDDDITLDQLRQDYGR